MKGRRGTSSAHLDGARRQSSFEPALGNLHSLEVAFVSGLTDLDLRGVCWVIRIVGRSDCVALLFRLAVFGFA